MIRIPTRIYYGAGAVSVAADSFYGMGSRAFIITGKNSARESGALDSVISVLREGNISWEVFDRVGENPELDCVMEGAEKLSASGADYVVGIGGGSPLDAAKAISLIAANRLSREDIYKVENFKTRMPIAAVPTSSGTGSEVTPYAVLTDPILSRKAGFTSEQAFPDLAICDPGFTFSLPRKVTLHTAIDALSHLLEGIYSIKRDLRMLPLLQAGIGLIVKHLQRAIDEPTCREARSALMRAALYGGVSIAGAGTTLQHSIGYPLTSRLGLSHGLSNGVVMRQVMDLYYPAVGGLLDKVFAGIGLSRAGFCEWLEGWGLSVGQIPDDEFIAACVPEVMGSRNMANNPFPVGSDQIADIYRSLVKPGITTS